MLAAAQEGGHHPRFNEQTLRRLPVPTPLMAIRDADSARVEDAVAMFRSYERQITKQVVDATGAFAIELQST